MPVLQHEPEFEASTKSQQVLGLRNEEWNRVQSKVLSVFNKRRLQPGELYELNKMVKVAIKSEIGSFISEYYKKNLLQRGMKSLYDSLDNDAGHGLLTSLAELWNYFFTEILPTLRAIFYPVQTKGLTMYQLSLLGFRDHVVLQLPLAKALSSCSESEIPPEITQMLLNLHAVHDGGNYATTPSEEYVQLEVLLAKVVCPFLGSKGLYLRMGEDDPAVPARDPNAKEDGQGTTGSGSGGTQGRKYAPGYVPRAFASPSLAFLRRSRFSFRINNVRRKFMRMRFSDDTPDQPSEGPCESLPEFANKMSESAKTNNNG